mmetsp:Transcript_54629/g.122240  ORF Transcript_54629/g.122240 Transcript_54629/m.122240 type:complete len:200 (-) Transcript_54629:615-1214(-)
MHHGDKRRPRTVVGDRLAAELDASGMVRDIAILDRRDEEYVCKVAEHVLLRQLIDETIDRALAVLERELSQTRRLLELAQPPDPKLHQTVGAVQHAKVRPGEGDERVELWEQVLEVVMCESRPADDPAEGVADERELAQARGQVIGAQVREYLLDQVAAKGFEGASRGVLLVSRRAQEARASLIRQQQRNLVAQRAQVI